MQDSRGFNSPNTFFFPPWRNDRLWFAYVLASPLLPRLLLTRQPLHGAASAWRFGTNQRGRMLLLTCAILYTLWLPAHPLSWLSCLQRLDAVLGLWVSSDLVFWVRVGVILRRIKKKNLDYVTCGWKMLHEAFLNESEWWRAHHVYAIMKIRSLMQVYRC